MIRMVVLVMAALLPSVYAYHNHGTDQHTSDYSVKSLREFNDDLHKWIQSKFTTDNQTVSEIVDVAFSRLGLYNRRYCEHQHEHEHNMNPITEAFKRSIVTDNSTEMLKVPHIYGLFHRLLSVATYTNTSGLCCSSGDTEECLQPVEYVSKTLTLSEIFQFLKIKYNRNAYLRNINSRERLKYEVEAYANRFQCVDERTVAKTIRIDDTDDIELRRELLSSVIVYYILKGYNFLGNNDVCPFTFLYSLYDHYGGRDNKISEHGLSRMLHDLKACPTYRGGTGEYQYVGPPLPPGQTPLYFDDIRHKRAVHRKKDPSVDTEKDGIVHKEKGRIVHKEKDRDKRWSHNHFEQIPAIQYKDSDIRPWSTGYFREYNSGRSFLHEASHQLHTIRLSQSEQCFETQTLKEIFTGQNGSPHDSIKMSLFLDMCPALLQQALLPVWHQQHQPYHPEHKATTFHTTQAPSSHIPYVPTVTVNSSHTDSLSNNATTAEKITRYKSYLYGSLCVLVISLCSIVGAGFMKLSRADVKIYLMGSLLSLAVGCLVADAVLHLLPEVVLVGEDGDNEELIPDYLRKLCAFLGSIYAFFVLEMILSTRHTHSHVIDSELVSLQYAKEDNVIRETNLSLNNRNTKPQNNQVPKTVNIDHGNSSLSSSSSRSQGSNQGDHSIQVLEPRCSNASDRISIHDAKSGLKALAWMIILGDGIHNFADGLAIGAAFSLSFTKGISTSITVLCHELPHELGDFAILVSTGMSIKRAMLLNFLSSLTAFAGLYVGLALGAQEEASQWIFAIGAGMFLYVALTDLIPECKEYFKQKCTVKMFIGQNLGLLLGYIAMLLLAIYEEKLEIKA